MKSYLKLTILILIVTFTSCQDVVDIEVQTAPSRLVIEASLDWEKGTLGNEQTIKLSTSKPYFDTTKNLGVIGASVKVTNDSNGDEFIFTDQNNGNYITTEFVPIINQSYTLEVIYNEENYTATETLMSVVDNVELSQSREDGSDDEALEIKTSFNDPEAEENFYLLKFNERGDLFSTFINVKDEFINGNEVSIIYEKEDDKDSNTFVFEPGDVVDVEVLGISEAYYDFIGILIAQSEGVGLFGTTPVSLKGNCVNLTNPDNYANGYFRLTEVVKKTYTFK
ncbi:DUF4249 family protein [Aquimarina muelleri]|uniref:DUF4249 domain-containing protein n=1 Tax=Aquimarina muelleri TaxID=279356 RepID=A0A918N4V7_9FLAO|nr:DUF4249 family protein [Aquimarina muelleri]MCX2764523.1 DUF4249 domain-containing protein [Aquimarina muelleri]GGX33122.1 hypothetical protein GCM10007384_37330 [Aquimarina muelleri]